MDLTSGTLRWPETVKPLFTYEPLRQHVRCDIVVIGGGMGGAQISYELSKLGYCVIVLEKHTVGSGSTSANTGLLQYCNDKTLTSCIHTYGEEAGVRFYRLCKQMLSKLLSLKEELLLDPELFPRSSLYLASYEAHVPKLRQEYEMLMRYGFPVEWWTTEDIKQAFGFAKPAAIVTHGDAEVNPFRFIHSLFHTAVQRYGLQIYEQTRVNHHVANDSSIIVTTADGYQITAKHAVFAMGYETQEYKRDRNAILESSFALVSEPIVNLDSSWYERMLIWETARPYLYLRTTPDNRIIIGGFDEATTILEERDRMLLHKTEQLIEEANKLFPSLAPLHSAYAWAATFGSTHDGFPFIGRHPAYPRCLFIEGYGGNGTVCNAIATEIIPAILEHGEHPDEHLFRFTRPTRPFPPQ